MLKTPTKTESRRTRTKAEWKVVSRRAGEEQGQYMKFYFVSNIKIKQNTHI